MPELFENTTLGTLNLKNRFVRSATWEGLADYDGTVTQELIDMYTTLADGEVGLLISGHAYVIPEGQAVNRQTAVYDDDFMEGLEKLAGAVHDHGGRIALQLAHAGCLSSPTLIGKPPVGPSLWTSTTNDTASRAMTLDNIHKTVQAFGDAAGRAKQAGFDAVQIHAAHGYFLSEFLSPYFNRRRDEYGGSIENRARIVMEVYRAVRRAVGEDYPVLIKLNAQDFLEDGFTMEEMLTVSDMLSAEGIDAIEMSGGTGVSPAKYGPVRPGKRETPEEEVFYREEAAAYKARIRTPLILVGGFRTYETAEKVIKDGLADFVSICRPLICEPNLIARWKNGDRKRAKCLSDNQCFKPGFSGRGVFCYTYRKKEKG